VEPPPRPDGPALALPPQPSSWAILPPKALTGEWPLATWTMAETITAFLAAIGVQFVVVILFGGVLDLKGRPLQAIAGLFAELSLGAAVVLWLRWAKHAPVSQLGLPTRRRWGGDVGFGLLVGLGIIFANGLVASATRRIVTAILGHEPASPPTEKDILTGAWLVPAVLLIVVVAPIAEEILFRGFLYQGFRRKFRIWPAALISSGTFAFFHVYPLVIPAIFASGVILALLYEKRRSLLASMTAHATLNMVAVIGLLARR
jgi:membrane protease YdiL (CAAX protease family)